MDPRTEASSWSVRGAPVPYLRFDAGDEFCRTLDKRLLPPCHEAALDAEAHLAAAIPVDRIQADTLLISLTGDVVWSSRRMADAVAARTTEASAACSRPEARLTGSTATRPRLLARTTSPGRRRCSHLGLPYRVGRPSAPATGSSGDRR